MFLSLVQELVKKAQSVVIDPSLVEIPQDRTLADFALPCFRFAKELKKSPADIAMMLATELDAIREQDENFSSSLASVVALGPYVNVSFKTNFVASNVLPQIIKETDIYGAGSLSSPEVLVVESPGPNTNKPLHLGHVRNMLLGNSVALIAQYVGFNVKKVDVVNDRGVHICKSMLAYDMFGHNAEPDKKSDHYVGDWYVRYDKESKKDPSLADKIQDMLLLRESGDEKVRSLREKMRSWSLDGMHETYVRFGCDIEKAYFESDHYLKGKEIVQEGVKTGLFVENEKGNVVYEHDDLGEKVVLRSDGSSIYITQDIALAHIRYTDRKMDRMVYVVGNEQSDHFKFLFEILRSMGESYASSCHHLSYGMISLPDGKMKSREGNVVDADTLADTMHQSSFDILQKRYPEELASDHHEKAEKIALGAIKFFILKYDAKKDFVFDRKESLSFDGESGPYLQYAYARCSGVLEKASTMQNLGGVSERVESPNYDLLETDQERLLLLHLSEFGDLLYKAANEYKPSLLARYVLDLAREFNAYYQGTKILSDENVSRIQARLVLLKSLQQVLKIGLKLLGIDALEKM